MHISPPSVKNEFGGAISKVNLVWPALCFAVGTVFGTSLMAVQGTGAPSQVGPSPIIEQTAYYANPGLADAVYDHRVHASDVRQKIGLPRGRVFRRVGGTGDLPDVVWQLEYA